MSEPESPRSTRWPWFRSLVYSLIGALSPAVWVIETQSCSDSTRTPHDVTGVDLLTSLAVDSLWDRVWIVALLLVMLAAPFLAWRARTPLRRIAWHWVGLFGAAFGTLSTFTLVMFVIFASRVVRPVGFAVLTLSIVPLVESIVRLVLSFRERRPPGPAP